MKKFLLWIWQMPQHLLALIVIALYRCKKNDLYSKKEFYSSEKVDFGVSLGEYRILNLTCIEKDELHEWGHTRQSHYLGWLYLLIIGLPSVSGNLWDRFFHKNWTWEQREQWYYNQPWEKWADKLGGVER